MPTLPGFLTIHASSKEPSKGFLERSAIAVTTSQKTVRLSAERVSRSDVKVKRNGGRLAERLEIRRVNAEHSRCGCRKDR